MTTRAPVFDEIIADYCRRVAAINDRRRLVEHLGVTEADGGITVPLFDGAIIITKDAILNQRGNAPSHSVGVLACQYLLLCPDRLSDDTTLCTFKDFRDAAPYVGGFRNTVEGPIADTFAGRVDRIEAACRELGGRPFDTDVSCQLAFRFQALPRIPVCLLFHDADDEFSAQCTLLFQRNAAAHLDMECLAMVGGILAHRLQG